MKKKKETSLFPKKESKYCGYVSQDSKCFRKKVEGQNLCERHIMVTQPAKINTECPICLMDESEDDGNSPLYPLSCLHRAHLDCISGMNTFQCPLCRERILNLPQRIKRQITANAAKYKKETQEEEERQIMELVNNENQRLPPQMEVILAMKYVFDLGIPLCLIPAEISIELDPETPLPSPGYIFHTTVKKIIDSVRDNTNIPGEEDGSFENSEGSEDDSFSFEGEDLQIIHRVRTIPVSGRRARAIASTLPELFGTVAFNLSDIPSVTEEDLFYLSSEY